MIISQQYHNYSKLLDPTGSNRLAAAATTFRGLYEFSAIYKCQYNQHHFAAAASQSVYTFLTHLLHSLFVKLIIVMTSPRPVYILEWQEAETDIRQTKRQEQQINQRLL